MSEVNDSTVKMGIRGEVELVLEREDGTKVTVKQPNLITNAGFDLLCDVLGNNSQPSDLTHIGIGSDSTAPAASNTRLGVQSVRRAATYAHTNGTKVMTLSMTVPAGTATGTIREAGCFNASTGGVMFNRTVFSDIVKGAQDSLTVTFSFTFS